MASSKPIAIPCGPCGEDPEQKADIWCYNCDEGLCSACFCHHKKSRASLDHKTIDIKSYKPFSGAIKTECDKHGQQLNLYCPSHLMPCCDDCISKKHSKCTGIKSLVSVVEKTKIEQSKQSVQNQIDSIKHFLDKLIYKKSKKIKRCDQEKVNIKEVILKIRKDINKHLTHLEKKLCNEADTISNQEKSKAKDLITEIEGKQKTLQEMQDHLQTVIPNTSKLQSFLGIHQIEQQVHQCQQYVEDLKNDDRAKKLDIKITQNKEIEKILSKLGSLESLGEVIVDKTEVSLNRETSARRKAQVESREQSNINNIKMKIEKKIGININNGISDTICLMNGSFIVVEWSGKVNLFSSNGKVQKQLPIPGKAYGVTQINQNTIAITYPTEKAIKIFNMDNEKVTKVIPLDKQCRGLSSSNNYLAVGLDVCNVDGEIRIIDLEGNTLKSIQVKSKSHLKNLVYCNDRVIYSDYNGKAVYCYDGSGKQIWQYTQDLSGPEGLCTDSYGNIIVVDNFSERITVISKDGQKSKVLISEEDGLHNPRCICFKHNESSGFIYDEDGTYLATFNLSAE
ncbi:unnamed protein product [Mytilus edulis]|uniref:B box-type domain-containing protein n=1 Tax=Mytilus edulis TaxID=6550 RepID=A0A8S3U183_MYTED|nr:unnamed protein product [Mytilus edulis]